MRKSTSKRGRRDHNSFVDQTAATEAGLQYVHDDRPGYTRSRRNGAFEYFDTQDNKLCDEQRLLRIKRLAIPPAWKEVWICPSPIGHIQATGRDARRRKQYRYHERWRQLRDENKFDRLAAFGKALPRIRRRVAADLKLSDLPQQKVLATVVRLLERTFIRVGNEEYARQNKSFGLTTIKSRHVTVKGAHLRFRFRGKSGRQHEVDLTDLRIAKIVAKCQDLPGQDLFQYVGDDGEVRDVTSQDVNDYLREITGEDFTAKDFRTWAGTLLAAIALQSVEAPVSGAENQTAAGTAASIPRGFQTRKEAEANVKVAISAVAELLGNTPLVCRKCYVHPAVLEAYLNGTPIPGLSEALKKSRSSRLRSAEAALVRFLMSPSD